MNWLRLTSDPKGYISLCMNMMEFVDNISEVRIAVCKCMHQSRIDWVRVDDLQCVYERFYIVCDKTPVKRRA